MADDNLKKITDSICLNKKTDSEKAQAIYLWVQNHMKYVAFEDGMEGFVPRQAADVCPNDMVIAKTWQVSLRRCLRLAD